MKFLIIGLGSMGKRRIRNLKALNIEHIAGFDLRADRCDEAAKLYGIKTFTDFDQAIKQSNPTIFIISTSPEHHMHYAFYAYQHNIHCFIEASVVEENKILELHQLTIDSKQLFAPSCTMRYYAGPRKVEELIKNKAIGDILNINYHVGQYLPDWHPWEDINDYYVSKEKTGGCREIVPFELTWLDPIFGKAEPLALVKRKLSDMPAPIDDIYHCLLRYQDNILANLTIEVLSRPCAVREMIIIGSEGQIVFSGYENAVRYIHFTEKEWHIFPLATGTIEKSYINPEEPYINELNDFIQAVDKNDKTLFPNSLLADYGVLKTLTELEGLN